MDLKTHKLLLELGADPNYDGGFQCFFNALLGCRKEVIKLLLDYGANINAISFEDCPIETVLDEAYDDSSYFYWQCEPEKQKLCNEIIDFLIT